MIGNQIACDVCKDDFVQYPSNVCKGCASLMQPQTKRSVPIPQSCTIQPGAIVEDGAQVGEHCVFHSNCFVSASTIMGPGCVVQPGAIVGSPAYAFRRDGNEWKKDGVYGGVKIGKNVHVGSCTVVDVSKYKDAFTVIEDEVKIDNLCHIAHDCHIGHGALIIAGAILGGHVVVGPWAKVYINSTIKPQIQVQGPGLRIGMGSVVTKSISDGGKWYGVPARKH